MFSILQLFMATCMFRTFRIFEDQTHDCIEAIKRVREIRQERKIMIGYLVGNFVFQKRGIMFLFKAGNQTLSNFRASKSANQYIPNHNIHIEAETWHNVRFHEERAKSRLWYHVLVDISGLFYVGRARVCIPAQPLFISQRCIFFGSCYVMVKKKLISFPFLPLIQTKKGRGRK